MSFETKPSSRARAALLAPPHVPHGHIMRARRHTLTVLFALLITGAMTMSDEAYGQEKKDPTKPDSFDEVVSVRFWDGAKFIKPVDDVRAFRHTDKGGVLWFWTQQNGTTAGNPGKGSELTDKDGKVYVCEKATKSNGFTICTVKPK